MANKEAKVATNGLIPDRLAKECVMAYPLSSQPSRMATWYSADGRSMRRAGLAQR
ncbi:hypothetical protein [Kibdelosporangium philippinense]|uniref:hypothetical protein n=1 Tax=Kibdelosporangium philippinense TaxID=211113 RepID=UPI00360D3062